MIKIEKQNDNEFISELDGVAKTITEEFVIGLYEFMTALSETGVEDEKIHNIINAITKESLIRFELEALTEDII